MNNTFIVSLVKNGILGGGLYAKEEEIIYHTGKVFISDIVMKYQDISNVSSGFFLFFPCVSFHMKDDEEYKFLVFFSTKRLIKTLKEKGVTVWNG